jgi:hypothetical protein
VTIEAELLDLVVGVRPLEVAAQRLGRARSGQRGVPALLGVADGEPGGVEGQDSGQFRQDRFGSLLHVARSGHTGQLLP